MNTYEKIFIAALVIVVLYLLALIPVAGYWEHEEKMARIKACPCQCYIEE